MSGSLPEPVSGEIDVARPAYGQSFAERWVGWRREPRLATAVLALIALAAGAWWVRLSVSQPSATGSPAKTGEQAANRPTDATSRSPGSEAPTPTTAVFVVDVVGAVRHPGVVSLPGTARVVDAVGAAGGALPNADLERINMAAHLVDGMRIAVPRRGAPADAASPTGDGGAGTGGGTGATPTPTAPLDLNAATQAQLEALPGIGPSLAQAIIQERDREGGFHSVDDLRRVRGIGDVRFAQIRPLVTV